tara:strand:- start:24 stop:272 length:249 start_codon:yes stop_codon:yes gene_type:complete
MNNTIKQLLNDTQILDNVIQKCIDYSETDWSASDKCPVGAFTDIAWFVMASRKANEHGVDIPTSPDSEEFWKTVEKMENADG